MGRYTCPLCGTEYDSDTEHDIHHGINASSGKKGGSASMGNKARDAIEDIKNAAGDLGRDIRDDLHN